MASPLLELLSGRVTHPIQATIQTLLQWAFLEPQLGKENTVINRKHTNSYQRPLESRRWIQRGHMAQKNQHASWEGKGALISMEPLKLAVGISRPATEDDVISMVLSAVHPSSKSLLMTESHVQPQTPPARGEARAPPLEVLTSTKDPGLTNRG